MQKAAKAPMPAFVSPMLATLVDAPFDRPGWVFEVKWDGYRAIAHCSGTEVALQSRNGKSFDERFYPVTYALKNWGINAVFDGEIVTINEKGIPGFALLQNWKSEADGRLFYYVFDVLWHDGRDLTALPLTWRRKVLAALVPADDPVVRVGHSAESDGLAFFDAAVRLGLEGIVAKRSDSRYVAGQRSADWLKMKSKQRQEVVIGGYFLLDGTSRPFSSLLLGVYENNKLRYAGKVGTGFDEKEQQKMLRLFSAYERKTSPFTGPVGSRSNVPYYAVPAKSQTVWLEPELVCEISYSEITTEGLFRHPVFIALREDKNAEQVMKEKARKAEEVLSTAPRPTGRAAKESKPATFPETKVVNGIRLEFSNLKKVLWPDDGYTKGDMLMYYSTVARYILPYLKNRPQSLNRYPNGIKGGSFYQKDVTGKVPDWVEKFPYKTPEDRKQKHYMLCNNEAALLLMANLGAIEMNPWSSTIQKPDYPTWCIFDLDPDEGNSFDQVIEVAAAINDFLTDIKIPSRCKTSGSTGIHIYVPLGARYTYDQSQLFARWVATEVDKQFTFTSVERMTDKRTGKIYIDFLQNRPAATLAAPYSLRPKPGATVSMPLYWEEVKPGLKMTDFTISNAEERVRSEGDLFKPVLGKGIDLKKILRQIS
ncbi:DNA ligase D [Ravibacter arvi]